MVLKSATGNQHKLKWILRCVHDTKLSRDKGINDKKKGDALDKGIEALLKFGGYFEDDRRNKKIPYLESLFNIFKTNGVNHQYDTDI